MLQQLAFYYCVGFLIAGSLMSCSKNMPVALSTGGSTDTAIKYSTPRVSDSATGFLALGDSYTIGQSVTEDERFPAQTKKILEENGINPGTLNYIARSGWTSSNLLAAIANENLPDSFNIIVLLIGVNDQYRGFNITGYSTNLPYCCRKALS